MWIKRLSLAPAAFVRVLLSMTILLAARVVVAADPPTVKQALGVPPHHIDFEYDTPDPKTYDQCKVAPFKEGKATGWIVTGPAGQPLRRFMETAGKDLAHTSRLYNKRATTYHGP